MMYCSKCEEVEKREENHSDDNLSTVSEVKHVHNRVYFYSPIDDKSVLKFQESLELATISVLNYSNANRIDPAPIYIHINSGGGALFAGFAAMDIIERCPAPTITIVEGRAASAATLMSLAANTRLITPHSSMLIHQVSSGIWGTYENIKDHKHNIERAMDTLRNIYLRKTKLGKKMLNDLLKHDLYFHSEKCVKLGLVDGIYRGRNA